MPTTCIESELPRFINWKLVLVIKPMDWSPNFHMEFRHPSNGCNKVEVNGPIIWEQFMGALNAQCILMWRTPHVSDTQQHELPCPGFTAPAP